MPRFLNKKHTVSSLFLLIIICCASFIVFFLLLFLTFSEKLEHERLLFLALLFGFVIFVISGKSILRETNYKEHRLTHDANQIKKGEADNNLIKDLQNEKKYFAGVLSHDLRSPLSSIILLTSYLKSKNVNSESTQYIELIEQSARKELDMMSTLLSLMRADSYRTEAFEELQLNELIEQILKSEESSLAKKQLKTDLSIPQDLTVFADPQVFKVILKNLILQAICFSDDNKVIQISSEGSADRIVIELVITSEELGKQAGEDLFSSDRLFTKSKKDEFPECIDLYFSQQAIRHYNGTIHVQVENNLSCRLSMSLERFSGRNTVKTI